MQRAVIALCACAGCNSWLGLDPTTISTTADAPIATFDPLPLKYQFALTDAAQVSTVATDVIPGLTVRLGRDTLEPATYDSAGNVLVPQALRGQTWRLEYTIPGAAPVEYQWTPTTGARICLPRFGRTQQTPLPPGGQVLLNTQAISPGTGGIQLLTSGVWTQTPVPSATGTQVVLPFTSAVPLDGQSGDISAASGDWEMALNYIARNGGIEANAYAKADASLTMAEPVGNPVGYAFQGPEKSTAPYSSFSATSRFMYAGPLYGSNSTAHARIGLIASDQYAAQRFGDSAPVMFAFGIYDGAALPASYAVVNSTVKLPHALWQQWRNSRAVGGISLDSSIALIDVNAADAYPSYTTAHGELAPIPTHVTLDGTDLMQTDGNTVARGTGVLSWQPVVNNSPSAGAVATLVNVVEIPSMTVVRRYLTAGSSVTLDESQLAAAKTYAVRLDSIHGYPDVRDGDLCTVDYPMEQTQLWAGTFQLP